jgi:hypothetical protein
MIHTSASDGTSAASARALAWGFGAAGRWRGAGGVWGGCGRTEATKRWLHLAQRTFFPLRCSETW